MNRFSGLDVHKDSVFLCIIDETGVIYREKFGVLTPDLERLSSTMKEYQVAEVAMESTSIYWIPIWRVLEGDFILHLVNPYFIKQLPGRKSDVKDAEWIATCLMKNLISDSFVPEEHVQQLRQYDRRIFDLSSDIVRKRGKIDAGLQRCNFRLSNYVSTTDSKSYTDVLKKIISGVTDPDVLIKEIHGRIINKHGRETIMAALTGVFAKSDIDTLRQLYDEVELASKHKAECMSAMDEICRTYFGPQYYALQTIPGVKARSAASIIASIGVDMSKFKSEKHVVSWAGLKPRNEESAGKVKSRRITHGNRQLKKTLIECSWGARKQNGCFFNRYSYIQCTVRKKNTMKVQVAIARKILVTAYFILLTGEPYRDYNDSTSDGKAA